MPQNTRCPESILATIPWYPNGLTLEERGAVESHAADCVACRTEIAFLQGDEEPAVELPDADRVYARVLERIQECEDRGEAPPLVRARSAPVTAPGRKPPFARLRRMRQRLVQPVGIAAGLLVAVVSGMLTVGVIWVAREVPTYETASVEAHAPEANGPAIEIVFHSDATADAIAADLRAAGASLSSGPNGQDVYRARLEPGADVEAVLSQLRGAGHGVANFAERSIR